MLRKVTEKRTHSINQVHNVTGEDVKQPYLGDTRPDVDENVDRTNWKGDDAEGSADEGIDQFLPADLKGKTKRYFSVRPYQYRRFNHVR